MPKAQNTRKPKYYLADSGEFVIENYNFAKPFANFFPAIAGKYGIPMWVFYVNRGQAVISFGTKDKDHAMLEFFPANRAWQLVSLQGFRTFIKDTAKGKNSFYEPFHNGFVNSAYRLANSMSISPARLRIKETNLSLGLETKVEYFNIPQEPFAGLVRNVTIKNLSHKRKKIQVLDGLPQIVPFGTGNLFLKKLSRTIEAWMQVENLEHHAAFYRLRVDPTDRPEVVHIKEGNFYLSFHYIKDKAQLIKPIVDAQSIFGVNSDFAYPQEFLASKYFNYPENEQTTSKMPAGFSLLGLELYPQQEKSFYTVTGYMRSLEALNASIKKITTFGYLNKKSLENISLIEKIQNDIRTSSSLPAFDLYAKQTYLDNVVRGGYPQVFKTKNDICVFYLYSRKHGDLERDYNKFQIQPTYYSQGNGNYRDVNQNRRCDTWFNPEIKDENIITFFNLIQTDGFNPLVVKGMTFILRENDAFKKQLIAFTNSHNTEKIISFLAKPFTPGDILLFLEENHLSLKINHEEFLNILLAYSAKNQEAEHAEGFWTDHWTYNLDLLENYLAVYPEKLKEIIFEKRSFTYFDNAETVKPRAEKFLLYNGSPRQLHALASDGAKKEMIKKRAACAHVVRTDFGKGEIYTTTLINKLLCLAANKLASLDPCGTGIEMEANKPNWYDALNGLPALFGSSLCETFELKRLLQFIKYALLEERIEETSIGEEIHDFAYNLDKLLQDYFHSNSADKDFLFWDLSHTVKEDYRHKTRFGVSGKETPISTATLIMFIDNALKKLSGGIEKAYDKKKNIYYSYFFHEVADYEPLKTPFIKPTRFIQKRLPLFLEGQMHALRTSGDLDEAKRLYSATKTSELYDKKLKMYKVTAPLSSMPEEIGRCRAFTPGWLENESIWLHMEYKYLLEALKHGLYDEFYSDFKEALIPFQKPAQYGRSILENSSFLVSSAFANKDLHGNGFVARLSGSTAEFLQIWMIMHAGLKPFTLDKQGNLNLCLAPILPGWLFSSKGEYSFNFLSQVLVSYHNPKKKDTFGPNAVKIKKIIFPDTKGKTVELSQANIPSPYAEQIRSRQIKQIDIHLA